MEFNLETEPLTNFDRELRHYQQAIISSKDNEDFAISGRNDDFNNQMTLRRKNRALVVTFTTTTTSFVFSTTIVKKTINLIHGINGSLTCLPDGFVIC